MANGSTENWLEKLQDALTDLKVVTTSVEAKLDQLKEGFEKVESSLLGLSDTTAQQEIRLTLIEQKYDSCSQLIPDKLNENFAIMQSQIATFQRTLWIISTCVIGLFLEIVFTKLM